MTSNLSTEERRLFARFKLKEGSFLITADTIGLLKDISLGGLSFQYFHRGQDCLTGSGVEIFLPFGHIQIKAGQYEVVGTTSQGEALLPDDQGQIRRYHLRFKNFTSEELRNFWKIIRKHCTKSGETLTLISTPSLSLRDKSFVGGSPHKNKVVWYLRQAGTSNLYSPEQEVR